MEVSNVIIVLLEHCVPLIFGETLFLLYNVLQDYRVHSNKPKRRRSKRKPKKGFELFYDILDKHLPEHTKLWILVHVINLCLFFIYHSYWPSVILWMLARYFKFFLRPIDHNCLINANQYLGIGLAQSYWDGFLSRVLSREGMEAIDDDVMLFEDQTGKKLNDNRFFVLIENHCDPPKEKADLDKAGIEVIKIEGAKGIPIPSRPQNMTFDIAKFHNHDKSEYVTVKYDFAQCLKSGMGPKWKMDPRMVKENLGIFLKEMKRHLSHPEVEARKNNIVFVTFDKDDKSTDLFSEISKKVGLTEIISSDSGGYSEEGGGYRMDDH